MKRTQVQVCSQREPLRVEGECTVRKKPTQLPGHDSQAGRGTEPGNGKGESQGVLAMKLALAPTRSCSPWAPSTLCVSLCISLSVSLG